VLANASRPELAGAEANESFTCSAAHAAYLRLRELIVTLQFAPGSTIVESDLERLLGVSRTPVREALQRLAHDGLLHIYPRRAIGVAKLGLSETREIFEVRVALEVTAAGLAAERRSEADLARLHNLASEEAAPAPARTPPRFNVRIRPSTAP
jgi:DNA-binding GntR family transcriptional regulator